MSDPAETVQMRWCAALRTIRHESEHSMDPKTRRRLTGALAELAELAAAAVLVASATPHYHCATGQEDTPCLCDQPGTYARQAPNPLAADEPVIKDDAYWDEIRQAVGRGAPSLLLGASTRSLRRHLETLRRAEEGADDDKSACICCVDNECECGGTRLGPG